MMMIDVIEAMDNLFEELDTLKLHAKEQGDQDKYDMISDAETHLENAVQALRKA